MFSMFSVLLWSVKRQMFSVQCLALSVQRLLLAVNFSMFSVICSEFTFQCSVFSVKCSVFSFFLSDFTVQFLSLRCSVFLLLSVHCTMHEVRLMWVERIQTITWHLLTMQRREFLCLLSSPPPSTMHTNLNTSSTIIEIVYWRHCKLIPFINIKTGLTFLVPFCPRFPCLYNIPNLYPTKSSIIRLPDIPLPSSPPTPPILSYGVCVIRGGGFIKIWFFSCKAPEQWWSFINLIWICFGIFKERGIHALGVKTVLQSKHGNIFILDITVLIFHG